MGYLAAVAAAGGMPYAKLFDASEAKAKMSTDELRSLGAWVRTWAIEGHGPVGPLAIVSSPGNQLDAAHFADAAGSTRLLRIFRRERKLAHGSIRPVYHRQADALGAPARPSPFAIPAPPASPQSLHWHRSGEPRLGAIDRLPPPPEHAPEGQSNKACPSMLASDPSQHLESDFRFLGNPLSIPISGLML